jgi:hypothetical protein
VAEHIQHGITRWAMINLEGSYFRIRLATLRTRLGQFQDCAVSLARLASGLSVCLSVSKWASTGARQTYSNAFRCFQGSRLGSVLSPSFWCCLSCNKARRFSFLVCAYLQQQRHQHHSQDVRLLPIAHYCTAAWKPFASCFIAVPCDWLAVCVRACLYDRSPSVPHFAARLACLRSACLLLAACYLLPAAAAAPLILYLCATPLPAAYPQLHPASHIPDYRVGCPHRIHPSIQTLALSPVPPLLALPLHRPASLPWRAPDLSSSSRGTRRRATPCAALGNYTRTTCGTCRPGGDRAPWTGQAHNAQGKQSTSRLTSSPTIPTSASSTNCQSTHSPTPTSLFALPAQGPAVECAQSQQSVLFSCFPKPNATRRCHCYPACCCCCFFLPHLTSLHLTLSMY